ncbi:XRE family transcriptional regulator [Paludisphaera borealis]|uniref:Antitoxin HigA2 n=1 Tax=Paludisphaera borealis TaxID=1387353 RepID=A0A1U7CJJ4_9BACT|nr:XRE family transcriptional regulator [Paludisphaera borealis]APW59104.1 Putative antitoxin HigA2 [Paludisphaera borealis]
MPIRLEDFVAKLPEEERAAIEKRIAELVEEVTLWQLREARKQSQKEVAKKLNVKQAAVSKLERRADMFVSTLRDYIESVGGTLEIIARFPNQDVKINQFRGLGSKNRAGVEMCPSGDGTSTH